MIRLIPKKLCYKPHISSCIYYFVQITWIESDAIQVAVHELRI